jgi:uncharacterized protein
VQLIDGRPVYSATDLVGFLACEHLTNLELAARAGLTARPMRIDPELDRIVKRGYQHEARFLDELRAQGLSIVEITPDGSIENRGEQLREAAARTEAAMRDGVDVVYQATFFDGRWRGHADFLRRVETTSDLGDWSYEVWDTKLARHVKGSAVLQLSLYSAMLAGVQGHSPERMHVALGGSERAVEHIKVDDYAAYFRLVRGMFDTHVEQGEALPVFPPVTRPEPVEHCDVCRWNVECARWRRDHDDLSLVAGIGGNQRRALRDRGIDTLTAYADATVPFSPPLARTSRESVARSHEQAAIQLRGRRAGQLLHELIHPSRLRDGSLEPNRGLLSLPPPSPGDLFFDIEGDPFALEDGVDYLFGILEPRLRGTSGEPTFHAIWSLDGNDVTHEAERRAFEELIDLFIDRLERDPSMHIYHYAPYEPTAIGRLMGRYGTREREVDRLLRGDVFVDLFRAVRQGIRASVESYSIKRLEPLYGFKREIDLRDAGSSIVAFETWLELGGVNPDDPNVLNRIEAYNRDDCVSNWLLRDWLETLRPELAALIGLTPDELPRLAAKNGQPSQNLNEHLVHVEELAERLTDRSREGEPEWLLAQLLSWHRREAKSGWWRYFYLCEDLTDEERIDEPEPIGALDYVGIVGEEKQSYVHRYRFPPQEHDIDVGRGVTNPVKDAGGPGTVVGLDDAAGTIDLKRGKSSTAEHPRSLVPDLVIPTVAQESSLIRIAEWVVEHAIDGPGSYRAVRELLQRRWPQVEAQSSFWGRELQREKETPAKAARRLLRDLDDSYLAIQGPPGSGKTTLGAEMIVDLVAAGRRVGVTSNSHKVIGTLLRYAVAAAGKRGVTLRVGQKPGKDAAPTCPTAKAYRPNDALAAALRAGEIDLGGATAWEWAREDYQDVVDVLFVDEAGQVSLANVCAVGPAGRNLVLLGDPQQLDQPIVGTHPPGAGRSALAHLLRDEPVMPANLGLFLDGTWRLHPAICAFTSDAFYDGKLAPYPGRERQIVDGVGPLDGAGLRWVEVEHSGNVDESAEEGRVVAALVEDLLATGATWTDDQGRSRPLRREDVVIVTPYNAQVSEIGDALADANVGTVDKFQGQEAPISIYSMATSTAEDAPRGMDFLYNLHRLNVATSRAHSIAVVVASPELIRVRCHTPRQMELANALARFVEFARNQAAEGSAIVRTSDTAGIA